MDDRPILSFCIATFQRYEILFELVQEILSVRTDKIEVIICDDKSLDESVKKIKRIRDSRLKIYVNEDNVGSSLNIHESLDKGKGKYLFYLNDRDNVDRFKIIKLLEILEDLEKEGVAFAKCSSSREDKINHYRIFKEGKEAFIQFACRIDHPTGYIFKREIWKKIKNKRKLFENQNYGDYPITLVSAIMSKNYKGAWIYGDICDVKRLRINFSKVKSGYYHKRKDKKLWFTPEVIVRELKIGQKFLRKIGVSEDISNQILINRYIEYLPWCITDYKNKIADPSCTAHNNFYPHQDFFYVFTTSIINGIKLWSRTILLCILADKKYLITEINKITRQEYKKFFIDIGENKLHIQWKLVDDYAKKDYEIYKREEVLKTYESWVSAIMEQKMVSSYLIANEYQHVALYGMGRIGKNLFEELQKSSIDIGYIIDQNMSKYEPYYKGVPCVDINSKLPKVDIIIVTIQNRAEETISELRKKVNWLIKSIDDILFVI